MSVSLFVALHQQRLPSVAAWQEQLDRFDVDLRLDDAVEPPTHGGYWPVTLEGVSSGFEFSLGEIEDVFDEDRPTEFGDRDLLAEFITHSDLRELKCSMLAAASLAVLAGGVAIDDSSGEVLSADDMVAEARSLDL